jgi:uncharacterized protein YndB with AHSA1/START domain
MTELTRVLGRIEQAGDTVTVVFDRHYATTPADLWQACTDPARLARWFAPVSGDLREGGFFTIHFDDADTPHCRVVSCEAPTRLVWEWPVGEVATLVTVAVTPDGDGARLVLRHARLDAARVAGYAAGWDTYVRRLAADLSGEDLPEWDATWTALHARYRAGT